MLKERANCSARKLRFSKFMGKGLHERTRIPGDFIKQMPEELSGITILQGPSSNGWPVKIMKSTNGTYLEDGWEAFVTDHSLTEGDILIFTYVSPMHFKVKIFGRNECEREDAFTVQVSLKSRRGDEAKFTAKDTSTSKASHGPTSLKKKRKCQSPRRGAGNMASTSKPKALKANEAAHHFTKGLLRPYFVKHMLKYYVDTHLAVPASFARKHLLEKKWLTLRSPNGSETRMKFYYGVSHVPPRANLIHGAWLEFVSANHIKEGDSCVFELVQEDALEMHVFRC